MITLPLLRDINRCLAHGHREGEWCERRDNCARHITIRHDREPVPACYRACHSDLMAAHIPLEGFPPKGASMKTIEIPPLADGETYVGAIGDTHGNLHHVILLPGDNDDADWKTQKEWAASIGGDLPSRIEQSMLWAGHREKFKNDAYWSNELHNTESGWAWYQGFSGGSQSNNRKDDELRARAVRRLPI